MKKTGPKKPTVSTLFKFGPNITYTQRERKNFVNPLVEQPSNPYTCETYNKEKSAETV